MCECVDPVTVLISLHFYFFNLILLASLCEHQTVVLCLSLKLRFSLDQKLAQNTAFMPVSLCVT